MYVANSAKYRNHGTNMKHLSFLLLLIFFVYACTPAKFIVDPNNDNNITKFNNIVEGNNNRIYLQNDEIIYPEKLHIKGDSLFYEDDSNSLSLPTSEVYYVWTATRPKVTTIIGLPILAAGIISIATLDDSGYGAYVKAYYGGLGVALGAFILVIGNNIESEIYRFRNSGVHQADKHREILNNQ